MVSASLKRNFINVWGTKFLFDYMKSVGVVFNKTIFSVKLFIVPKHKLAMENDKTLESISQPLFQSCNHKSKSRLGYS